MKPQAPAQHKELKTVRSALHELHRLMLSALRKDHERILGRVMNPAEWFQILISAPEYQWLQPLNSLLSDVDALSELSKIEELDLAILRQELEGFFFKENVEVRSFNSHYRLLLAQYHELIVSHGRLKQAFLSLPNKAAPLDTEAIRRGWHKTGASRRKLLN